MPRHCIRLPNGGFACGDFPTQLICDVCDRPVKRTAPKFLWRGVEIDLCPVCRTRYEGPAADPTFKEIADRIIAVHYPEAATP